jgi:hypothetical protein
VTVASPPQQPKDKRPLHMAILGAIAGAVGTILIGLIVAFLTPAVTESGKGTVPRLLAPVVGIDQPIELSPLCAKQGGILRPHAEKNAAYHFHCKNSSRPITKQQIAKRCAEQWGPEAELKLRDPDSASGWKCHLRGWLR